jgi:anthranilate phosphoribosyltransferase
VNPRRSTYRGFTATIKLVGTGPRGSRDLDFEEARAAMTALLEGEASGAQAGAFLMAMRLKGESPTELAGFAQALRDAAIPLIARGDRPLVACGGAYDGVSAAPHLSIATAVTAAACGVGVVMHCGTTLGPKRGVTHADVLAALGGPAKPSTHDSARMLADAGATLVYTPAVVSGWEQLVEIRDDIGVRGPLHAAERLLDFFGARRFVIGYTHSPYSARIIGALERLGAERAIAVRGIEGSDVARPGRPMAVERDGPLDLPEDLGQRLPQDRGADVSAATTRAVVAGEQNDVLEHAVAPFPQACASTPPASWTSRAPGPRALARLSGTEVRQPPSTPSWADATPLHDAHHHTAPADAGDDKDGGGEATGQVDRAVQAILALTGPVLFLCPSLSGGCHHPVSLFRAASPRCVENPLTYIGKSTQRPEEGKAGARRPR